MNGFANELSFIFVPFWRGLCFDRRYSDERRRVMQDFVNKKIVLGVCGGIAAYKSAYLVRELTRLGATVRVVMTAAAEAFITPMTFQALSGEDVRSELFDSAAERAMGHIELARWADLILIVPLSANTMAKLAHGLSDNLLTTLYLVAETPVLVCPAMNHSMWEHPATQANYQLLLQRGVMVIGPEKGSQACGEHGDGRMSEVEQIISALRMYEVSQCLKGRKVMITAGPTREAIDPVRYISNHSSGKMGYALAEAAKVAGAQVTLITGPTNLKVSQGIVVHSVDSAQAMYATVMEQFQDGMIFIGTAAVADYAIEHPHEQKIKKIDQTLTLSLTPNPDILSAVAATGKASYVVGFAAETQHILEHAHDKRIRKQVDMMIANQVGHGLGFDVEAHQVTVLTADEQIDLPLNHKTRLAAQIIAILAANLQNATPKPTILD